MKIILFLLGFFISHLAFGMTCEAEVRNNGSPTIEVCCDYNYNAIALDLFITDHCLRSEARVKHKFIEGAMDLAYRSISIDTTYLKTSGTARICGFINNHIKYSHIKENIVYDVECRIRGTDYSLQEVRDKKYI